MTIECRLPDMLKTIRSWDVSGKYWPPRRNRTPVTRDLRD